MVKMTSNLEPDGLQQQKTTLGCQSYQLQTQSLFARFSKTVR